MNSIPSRLTLTKPPAKNALRVLDVFAGAGGISMGFIAAGYRIVGAVEVDAWAAGTFEKNIPYFQGVGCKVYGGAENGDMTTISPEAVHEKIGDIDVLVGGPPCKAFSQIGRGKLNSLSDEGYAGDPRNKLYRNFLHFLEVFKPKAFIMENVPGMLSVQGRNVADVAAEVLSASTENGKPEYDVRYAMLDSSWYGVPQYRQRIIFMGIRKDLGIAPSMPPRRTAGAPDTSGYRKWSSVAQLKLFGEDYTLPVPSQQKLMKVTNVEDALGDLPTILTQFDDRRVNPRATRDWSEIRLYENAANSPFATLMRQWNGPDGSRELGAQGHHIRWTARDFETFERMNHGDTYKEALDHARELLEERLSEMLEREDIEAITEELRERHTPDFVPPYKLARGFVDSWKKLHPDRPSWTVTAHLSHDTYSHIHPDSDQGRAISVREAARLQGFPDRFWFGPEGGLNGAYSQIGNAVPPLMAHSIACHLRTLIS